jgi:hypothetical protein
MNELELGSGSLELGTGSLELGSFTPLRVNLSLILLFLTWFLLDPSKNIR